MATRSDGANFCFLRVNQKLIICFVVMSTLAAPFRRQFCYSYVYRYCQRRHESMARLKHNGQRARFPCRMSSTSGTVNSSPTATSLMKNEAREQLQILQNHYSTILRTQQQSSSFSFPEFWTDDTDGDAQVVANYIGQNIDNILFDCDGVLYRTLDECPGASHCISKLLEMGKTVLFVTNNAGVNRRELRIKLNKLLFNIEEERGNENNSFLLVDDQMVSSSYSSAQYLQKHLQHGSRVHVIGSSGLMEEITSHGFTCSGGPSSSSSSSMTRQELAEYEFPEHPIDAMVVGHDTSFDFRKLSIANNLLLQSPDALFVATNEDSFDLVGDNGDRHIPGNGCIVKALEHCSRRKAINVGKPSRYLAQLIFDGCDKDESESKEIPVTTMDPSRSLFVGDRLDTDIRFGNENGMKSLLVLTGVTTAKTMMDIGSGTEEEPLPHFIAPYVGLLVKD